MTGVRVLLVIVALARAALLSAAQGASPIGKTPQQIITDHAFQYKDHTVETSDGYRLNLIQIINPALGAQLKRPVLFNHGIFEAAPLWIYQSEGIRPREYSSSSLTNKTIAELQQLAEPDQRSMAFLLSNAGYNVFLLSMRGTDLSLGHRNISSATDAIYWNFSADELGLIDVRETIDYIRRLTGAPKIGYAGHSLGTMAITELLAERPEYANLVEPVFLIAQVSFISSSYSPTIGPLYRYYATRSALVQGNNAYGPFPPESQQIRTLAGTFCYRTVPIQEQLCRAIVESIGGLGQLNSSTEAVLSSVPYTQSTKVIAHLGQLTVSGRFAKFDYGIGNFARYGSVTSPDYNISAIRSNSMVFFYGLTDSLVTPADVERFFSRLTVKPLKKYYYDDLWNHFDPIGAISAGERVNLPALQILESFNQS